MCRPLAFCNLRWVEGLPGLWRHVVQLSQLLLLGLALTLTLALLAVLLWGGLPSPLLPSQHKRLRQLLLYFITTSLSFLKNGGDSLASMCCLVSCPCNRSAAHGMSLAWSDAMPKVFVPHQLCS